MTKSTQQVMGLLSIISIGVTGILGSGWLFAAYYTSQYAGSMSLISWILGAIFALILALMLAEIATMFPIQGLFARLLSLSHNKDLGFVISSTNWLSAILIIPSEAQATLQYVSYLYPPLHEAIIVNNNLSGLGLLILFGLILVYGLINYWGIKTMARITNVVLVFKIVVPLASALILIFMGFHGSNFTAYHNTWAPYGVSAAFTSIITGGVFYSFLGFGSLTTFAAEVKNPSRNIPLALFFSIFICLIIYMALQVAFIGAVPPAMVLNGWHNISFTSPIVQLILLLNLNFWAIILYLDAIASPSGTAITYVGSAGRILTGMAQDKQMPQIFSSVHQKFHISRSALIASLVACFVIVLFFRSWHSIMIVISALQLLTCAAIPVALVKFRSTHPDHPRSFKVFYGKTLSLLLFIMISYLMVQTGLKSLTFALIIHILLFVVYMVSYYKGSLDKGIKAFLSSWTIFFYMLIMIVFSYINQIKQFGTIWSIILFLITNIVLYYLIINQKNRQNP